jgi:hypothetical protein
MVFVSFSVTWLLDQFPYFIIDSILSKYLSMIWCELWSFAIGTIVSKFERTLHPGSPSSIRSVVQTVRWNNKTAVDWEGYLRAFFQISGANRCDGIRQLWIERDTLGFSIDQWCKQMRWNKTAVDWEGYLRAFARNVEVHYVVHGIN